MAKKRSRRKKYEEDIKLPKFRSKQQDKDPCPTCKGWGWVWNYTPSTSGASVTCKVFCKDCKGDGKDRKKSERCEDLPTETAGDISGDSGTTES